MNEADSSLLFSPPSSCRTEPRLAQGLHMGMGPPTIFLRSPTLLFNEILA